MASRQGKASGRVSPAGGGTSITAPSTGRPRWSNTWTTADCGPVADTPIRHTSTRGNRVTKRVIMGISSQGFPKNWSIIGRAAFTIPQAGRGYGAPMRKSCLPALACAAGSFAFSAPAAARDLVSFDSGKSISTNGVTTIEGSGGGGLATWATISSMGTDRAVGVSAHVTGVELPDFRLDTHGIAIGIRDRVELAYARQNFNTRDVGAALGSGRGFQF
ncbi:hypothetical protein OY671_008996, partial [Metschnikowia pulcherrima]